MADLPRMFAISSTPLAVIGGSADRHFIDDRDPKRTFWRFMRPLLTDEERIAGMANALRLWCATVDHHRARHVIYAELGVPSDAAERLDAPALRRLKTILEKERA